MQYVDHFHYILKGSVMISLSDFLAINRERLVAAWLDDLRQSPAMMVDADRVREQVERGFDTLVRVVYDAKGARYQDYAEQVVKPGVQVGVAVAVRHAASNPLVQMIYREINQQISDLATRTHLHEQIEQHLTNIAAAWDLVSAALLLDWMGTSRPGLYSAC